MSEQTQEAVAASLRSIAKSLRILSGEQPDATAAMYRNASKRNR